VEGLSDAQGDAVRQAFAKHHALQCGFCTPGFLATVVEMMNERFPPDGPAIRERLAGNLCRCTGYQNIVSAVTELLEDSVEPAGQP
ncbi:MAG: 2Fe-2S iron-sulfur cluster-binding protein, partial [Acidimicrobiia bacterium]